MKSFFKKVILSRAIISILVLAIINLIVFAYFFVKSHEDQVDLITNQAIRDSENTFRTIERNKTNMLSASIELLLSNSEIAEFFFKRNRKKLLNLCLPLFEHIKKQNGITHWYFIDKEPDKKCFLRVHNPDLYGDKVDRITLEGAVKIKDVSSGKELGKTALAIRAVHPFYYKKELIGYLELGVEIEEVFEKLMKITGNQYGLIIWKNYLNRSDWNSVRNVKHLRDNWNDHKDFLLIYKTLLIEGLDTELKETDSINIIPETGVALKKIKKNGDVYVRGVFPFYDVLNRKIGGIYILKNVTSNLGIMKKETYFFMILTLISVGIITFLMIFFHKRGENKLKKYRFQLEDLVEERTKKLLTVNEKLEIEILEHKKDQLALIKESEARNLAEIKHLQATQEVEKHSKMASIGVLAAGITHEINQPLNAIRVTADSIQYWNKKNKGKLPEIFVEQMSLISKSVMRISNIIKHMRNFWNEPGNNVDKKTDINKVINAALGLISEQMKTHSISKKIELLSKHLYVNCNPIHLEQIVINITINAINALNKNNNKNKMIFIETSKDEKNAIIKIQDNGPGLPTENYEELFDLFYSKSKDDESMGLGLAIVKRYVEKYNGNIEAKNNPDAGACFIISLPLLKTE